MLVSNHPATYSAFPCFKALSLLNDHNKALTDFCV